MNTLRLKTSPRFANFIGLLGCVFFTLSMTACKAPDLKPDFLKRDKPETTVEAPAPVATIDPSLTPRELLTARLVNPRDPASVTPGLTVGKLIEFADRYLACDCANTRFANTWRRIDGGYELTTNADHVHPLRFMCGGAGEFVNCYLTEIDRGSALSDLTQRFMPGADFIEFIYEHGINCPRVEPCPPALPEIK